MLKTTVLMREYENQKPLRFCHFCGWKLPREFKGASLEHLAVRSQAGLFDISYMSKIRIRGEKSLPLISHLFTNDGACLSSHQAQYSLLCNKQGGVLDDFIVYCLKPGRDYLLIGNALCHAADLQWIRAQNPYPEKGLIADESRHWAMIALQGPKAPALLSQVLGRELKLKKFEWLFFSFQQDKLLVSATGYTGEKGFEILIPLSLAGDLWRKILNQSLPCELIGLAARDTLRIEMKYPLYGQDLTLAQNPYSAGLGWVVKNPRPFIGSAALKLLKKQPVKKKWVGFCLKQATGVPRFKSPIFFQGEKIGVVTSGAWSPCLSQMIGLGYVDTRYSRPAQDIEVLIHQTRAPAQITATPFL